MPKEAKVMHTTLFAILTTPKPTPTAIIIIFNILGIIRETKIQISTLAKGKAPTNKEMS
jgi:hypothetical protein